jgi:hypothetical protein
MKNITVSVPNETYYGARVWAAEHKTSISRMVAKILRQMEEQPRVNRQPPPNPPPPPPTTDH